MTMTQTEAAHNISQDVIRCLRSHNFQTFGEILAWWHNASHDSQTLESGSQGMSEFSKDILWLISTFGPDCQIEQDAFHIGVSRDLSTSDSDTSTPPKRRKRRRRF